MILKHVVDVTNPQHNPELNSVYDKAFIEFFNMPRVQCITNTELFTEEQMNLLLFCWNEHLYKYEDLRHSAAKNFVLGIFLLNCGIDFRYLREDFLISNFHTDFNNYRIV